MLLGLSLIFAGTGAAPRDGQSDPLEGTAGGQPDPGQATRPGDDTAEQAGGTYEDLMAQGAGFSAGEDWPGAARRYLEAARMAGQDTPRGCAARLKVSRALATMGHHDEALRVARAVQFAGKPGEGPWKGAMAVSIEVLGELARWGEQLGSIYLLRANASRYGEAEPLNRWLAYRKAMARVHQVLTVHEHFSARQRA